MADRNEEQLLSALLHDLKAVDGRADAASLEPRLMAAWDRDRQDGVVAPSKAVGRRAIAAGCAVAAALLVWLALPESTPIEISPLPSVRPVTLRLASVNTPVSLPADAFRGSDPVTKIVRGSDPLEFVPLMPMSARELAGSFQIVRVQMPRASLGALTPPLMYPHDLIEADVLLGEDGVARAIRVSTSGSTYPGRSR